MGAIKKNPAAVKLAKLRAQKLSPERQTEISIKANQARNKKLNPARRSEIAQKAAQVRWKNKAKASE